MVRKVRSRPTLYCTWCTNTGEQGCISQQAAGASIPAGCIITRIQRYLAQRSRVIDRTLTLIAGRCRQTESIVLTRIDSAWIDRSLTESP